MTASTTPESTGALAAAGLPAEPGAEPGEGAVRARIDELRRFERARAAHPGADREPGDSIRAAARLEAQSLILRVQGDLTGTTADVDALVRRAEANEWWDVAILASYARVVAMTSGGQPERIDDWFDAMVRWCGRTGDPAARALTLAARARITDSGSDPVDSMTASADLATATILLESGLGGAFERIDAHIECGNAFDKHRLWELEIDQYVAALGIDLSSEHPGAWKDPHAAGGQWAIKNNLAEVQCHWVCALSLIGDEAGARQVAEHALPIFTDVEGAGIPDEWVPELEAMRLLICALDDQDVTGRAVESLEHVEPGSPNAGIAHLALAVCQRRQRSDKAQASLDAAIACLAGSWFVVEHELAIGLSVEAEADRDGGDSAGLRFVRHHSANQWADRIAKLNSMVTLLSAERFRIERETFERDAHVDDLTRLANRRGYHRYLAGFASGDRRRMAVLALDVDRFKAINDRFGHGGGDDALRRIGTVLGAHARPDDLAARMGGDEFVVVLAGAGPDAAIERAAQIIAALGRETGSGASGYPEVIPVSIGVATGTAEQVDLLSRQADKALYRAKSAGGGRAMVAAPGQ